MLDFEPSTMNRYFKKGDEFYINRYEEFTFEKAIYHAHEFVELCYVYSGKGYHIVDGKKYHVMKDDLFILNHDIPHVFYRDEKVSLVTYNLMFKPGFFDGMLINFNDFDSITLSYLFRNICDEEYEKENLRLGPEEQKPLEYIIENIYTEFIQEPDGFMNFIRAYMIQLIILIMRTVKNQMKKEAVINRSSAMINEVINYLQENFSQSFSLNELAMKSFYSKNYLCTIFKEATGITISQYVQNLRIREACRLLETTPGKITSIAACVGFPDYKAFNTSFKKSIGCSPKEYRDKNTRSTL